VLANGTLHEQASALYALNRILTASGHEPGELTSAAAAHQDELRAYRQAGIWYYDRQHTEPVAPAIPDHTMPSLHHLLQAAEASQPA